MTIAVAWVRRTKRGAEEVVLCSDSRLNGGGNLDSSPKVFQLPRADSGMAVAGTTLIGYPFFMQVSHAISSHYPMKAGVIDYLPFRSYVLRLMNELHQGFDTYVRDFKEPDTEFLLAGYSWFKKSFHIDRISYNKGEKRFTVRQCTVGIGNFGKILFIGDYAPVALRRLYTLLRERFGDDAVKRESEEPFKFDMEPFEVVVQLLREADDKSTIGGPPQLLAIPQHMHSKHLAVYWPRKEAGQVFVNGRPVFGFENLDNWILDPDTLLKEHMFLGAPRSELERINQGTRNR